jgi:Cu(I)/Ag(I) efflux system membrane fusion protein
MKTKLIYLAAGLLLAGGLAYFFRHDVASLVSNLAGEKNATQSAQNTGEETVAAPGGKKVRYWTDPMIPGFKSDKPGKSPMGMEMVPVYDEGEVGGGVKISPQAEKNIGLRTEKAAVRKISRSINAVGTVAYDERKVANIQSKVSGWVEKLYVNFTGEKVAKGDHLLEIYSPDLVSTEEEFLLALKNRDLAAKGSGHDMVMAGNEMYVATRKRLEYFDVPEHQIRELEQDGKVFKTLHLHSPYDGVLVSKPVFVGMQVVPGMTLYTVADLSDVWVMADVYESEIGWVRVGDPAEATLAAFPGRKFAGVVRYINPFLDKDTRTVKLRIEFANPELELKPEMYANVEIKTATHDALAAPIESVIRGGKKDVVIIAKGGGLFEPREIKLGAQGDGYFEVLSGLVEGEDVVTNAQFLIDSESNLHEAVGKMGATGAEAPKPGRTSGEKTDGNKDPDMKGMDMKGGE